MSEKDKTKTHPTGDEKAGKRADKSKPQNSADKRKDSNNANSASATKNNTGAMSHQKDEKMDIMIQKLNQIHSQVNENQKAIADQQVMMDVFMNHPDADGHYDNYDNEYDDYDAEQFDEYEFHKIMAKALSFSHIQSH